MCHCCCRSAAARRTEHSEPRENQPSPCSTTAKANSVYISSSQTPLHSTHISLYGNRSGRKSSWVRGEITSIEHSRTGALTLFPGKLWEQRDKLEGLKESKEGTKRTSEEGAGAKGRVEGLLTQRQPDHSRPSLSRLSQLLEPLNSPSLSVSRLHRCPADRHNSSLQTILL